MVVVAMPLAVRELHRLQWMVSAEGQRRGRQLVRGVGGRALECGAYRRESVTPRPSINIVRTLALEKHLWPSGWLDSAAFATRTPIPDVDISRYVLIALKEVTAESAAKVWGGLSQGDNTHEHEASI